MGKKQAPTLAKLKIRTQKLSVLLLRDTVASFDAAVKTLDGVDTHEVNVKGNVVGKLYAPKVSPKTPKWFYFLKSATGAKLTQPKNTIASALLILRQDGRYFAFTFGMGRNLLKSDSFVLDFGLKVGLNRIDKSKLKIIDSRT